MEYRLLIHLESLAELPKTGKRREAVFQFLAGLEEHHHLGGDYEQKDPETGRSVWVSEVAGFAITWWVDSPVSEVKVVDVSSLSKSG